MRPSYLMRTVPPTPPIIEHYSSFDSAVQDTFLGLLGPGASDDAASDLARAQITLPMSLGGVALRSAASTAPAAYLGSWALVAHLVAERFLEGDPRGIVAAAGAQIDTGVLPFQEVLRAAREMLPEDARALVPPFEALCRAPETGLQSRLTDVIDSACAETLRSRTADPAGRARLLSETGPGAAAWLGTVPMFQSLRMSDECFRTALRTWLGLRHPAVVGIRLCECGESLEGPAEGVVGHLMRCGVGSERNDTHDGIRDTVFQIMREAGYSVRREQVGIMPMQEQHTGDGRRVDLVGADPQGGRRILGDVVVADCTQERLVSVASTVRGHAAGQGAAVKEGKYHDHPADDVFIPMAVETYGCLGTAFDGFLSQCARRAAQAGVVDGEHELGREVSRMLCYFRQRVSISLQRSQARAVHYRSARAVATSTGVGAIATAPGPVAIADIIVASRDAAE